MRFLEITYFLGYLEALSYWARQIISGKVIFITRRLGLAAVASSYTFKTSTNQSLTTNNMSSVNPPPVFSADDESTWKVSGQYPPREVDGMDWQRCALLHNKILRLGWTARYGEAIPIPAQSWWNRFITSPTLEQTWTTRLSASLVQFLKCAQVTPQENEHAFHYYFSGLAYPGGFYQSKQEGEFEILTLYPLNNLNLGGHLDGLRYHLLYLSLAGH
jgi:hypothetical protein